jgi:hypothetical protein
MEEGIKAGNSKPEHLPIILHILVINLRHFRISPTWEQSGRDFSVGM